MQARILFVSNGVGEDLIASRIIVSLPDGTAVWAYPLVGNGVYPPSVPLLDPRGDLPSGGFSLRAGLRGLRADLAERLQALGIVPEQEIITHCQTHHRSGFTYLVARLLGYPRIKAYAGSWSEWGARQDTPVVTGKD